MKKLSKGKKAVALGAMALTLASTGILAYFTDTDSKTNTFTVGKIDIVLEEPSWTPPTDITPNKTFPKDPAVENQGKNSAYVFLEVDVPYADDLVVANDDGTKKPADKTDLFSYTIDSSNWAQVGDVIENDEDKIHTYVYVYSTDSGASCAELAKTGKTPALFSQIKFVNAIEGQGLEEQTKDVVVTAKAIQVSDLNGSTTDPEGVLSIINNQRRPL